MTLKIRNRSEDASLAAPKDPKMQLDWIRRQGKKATPLFVHFLMIASVGVYAIFGAVVMRKLEAKTVDEVTAVVHRRHAEQHDHVADELARAMELGLRHRRRRRHNESDPVEQMMRNLDVGSLNEREKRAAAQVMRSRRCVVSAIKRLSGADCTSKSLDERLVKELDKCYHVAVESESHTNHILFTNSQEEVESVAEEAAEVEAWSFMDSLLFAFTVITTIGYGNVAPRTFAGRLFVILYGLVGIPFTLLAIADLGKFLSEIMLGWTKSLNRLRKRIRDEWRTKAKLKGYENGKLNGNCKAMLDRATSLDEIVSIEEGRPEDAQSEADLDEMDGTQAVSLFIFFVVYIALGGAMLSSYEPDMDFFKAVYFNFVTLTSIGLGDIVPRSETYMALTIVYIAIGLALTTIAIEIAADTLKKLHYYGRKIENVGNVAIWFGGKKITMKALVKNLGDQFNLPTTVIKDLDLDNFVDQAIKVEEGEIETLRPPPFEPDPEEFNGGFMDEPTEEAWISDPTPSPSPEPEPEPPKEPTPEPTPIPTPVPSPEPPKEPTPEPTPEPSPVPTPTPPRELTPPPPPKTPTPPPRTPTPEPVREPTPEPPREPTPPPAKPRALTAAEIAAQKRRAYSEEAWRRYQEYQKQWKKFRQTQKAPTPGTASSGAASTRSGSGPLSGGSGPLSGPSSSKGSTQPGTPEPKP